MLVGTAGSQLLSLATGIILGRALSNVGFGEYGVIISTVGVLGVFAGMGLGMTATRHVAELRTRDPLRAGRILRLCRWTAMVSGGVISIVAALGAPYIATRVLNNAALSADLEIGCGLLFLNTIAGIQSGGLAGFEAFNVLARLSILRGAVSLGMTAVGVCVGGLRGALVALVAAAAVGYALNERALSHQCACFGIDTRSKGPLEERAVLWRFSVPALLSTAMVAPVTWFGNVVVVNQAGGYPEIGVFNAAGQWRLALNFLPGVIGQTFMPILSNAFGERHILSFKKVLRLNFLFVTASAALLVAPMLIFPRQLMGVFGLEFARGSSILQVLCIATVFSSVAAVVGNGIAGMGRMWHGFWLNLVWAAAFVCCSLAFAKQLAFGLALAYLVSYLVHAVTVGTYAVVVFRKLAEDGKTEG
jgi:O-antigen/teichoic acid export membrane protein